MKKTKKILLLVLCAALLVGASVMGTLAYLTDNDTATNTFTVGDVDIELKEYALASDYTKTDEVVDNLENIKLVPGRVIEKNPFITVGDTSEECWLFVVVENGLEGAGEITWAEGWTKLDGKNIWQYESKVAAGAEPVDVFTQFTCSEELTNEELAAFDGKTIVITAYAVQADGVSYDEAYAALDMHYFD